MLWKIGTTTPIRRHRIDIGVKMMLKDEKLIVPGFTANGIHAGIKEDGRRDLALIVSERPAIAAGVFTTNAFKAPPVLLDIQRLKGGKAQAIIANSGNANAATGEKGYRDAVAMAHETARALRISEQLVLVASTGMIGKRLPMSRIRRGIQSLVQGLSPHGLSAAEEGIMTTDRFPKIALRNIQISSGQLTLCGIAKGAGMIEPSMATMLSFIMTDAAVEREALIRCLKKGVDRTFNAISVDGCMSTNDSVIILANGAAGNRALGSRSRDLSVFEEALFSIMHDLALDIVRDGEGATKIIAVRVEGAASRGDARKAAFAIARSNLVKAAFFGKDPNWGRILSAVGTSGVSIQNDAVELKFDGIPLFRNGLPCKRHEAKLMAVMDKNRVDVLLRLGNGRAAFTVYASDLTLDYVKLNAHYHT